MKKSKRKFKAGDVVQLLPERLDYYTIFGGNLKVQGPSRFIPWPLISVKRNAEGGAVLKDNYGNYLSDYITKIVNHSPAVSKTCGETMYEISTYRTDNNASINIYLGRAKYVKESDICHVKVPPTENAVTVDLDLSELGLEVSIMGAP